VNPTRPRVPNPADPAEDYADQWAQDPTLETFLGVAYHRMKIGIAKMPRS